MCQSNAVRASARPSDYRVGEIWTLDHITPEMKSMEDVSPARILIEAVRLTTNAEILHLCQLLAAHPNKLPIELVLRIILSYLPEATEPRTYTKLIKDLWENTVDVLDDPSAIISPTLEDLSEEDARGRVRALYLQPLRDPRNNYSESSDDTLSLFLLHRAHNIDSETGSLPLVAELLKPFLDHSSTVRTWAVSTLLPLLRLDYEYYPQRAPAYSLEKFEQLDGSATVDALLSEAAPTEYDSGSAELDKDLRGLVGPWMYGDSSRKRRRLNDQKRRQISTTASIEQPAREGDAQFRANGGWYHVNRWLLDLASRDFLRVAAGIEGWNGPDDIDYGDWNPGGPSEEAEDDLQYTRANYAQAGLAAIYATHGDSTDIIETCQRVLLRVAHLADLPVPPDLKPADNSTSTDTPPIEYIHSLTQDLLLHDSLLARENILTTPSERSIIFCRLLLVSCMTLNKLGFEISCKHAAELSMTKVETEQVATLRKVMHYLQQTKIKDQQAWESIRYQILWLRDWNLQRSIKNPLTPQEVQGIFCRIGRLETEVEILKGSLDVGCKSNSTWDQQPSPSTSITNISTCTNQVFQAMRLQ